MSKFFGLLLRSPRHCGGEFGGSPHAALAWRWSRFDELTVFELDAIYRARQLVFAVEQQCAYLDADGFDADSFHLAAWSAPSMATSTGKSTSKSTGTSTSTSTLPLAYARVVHPGLKYVEPSIGRVITSASARGTGLGRELVRRAIGLTQQAFPGQGIRISAQTRLEAFYADAGFVAVGMQYLEDGILHTEMLRAG